MHTKQWAVVCDKARVDVWFKSSRGRIHEFAITLSAIQGDHTQPIVRYDTAHGGVHRHTFWGKKERIVNNPFGVSDPTLCFRLAYQDIKDNFDRYLEQFKQGGEEDEHE